LAPPVAAPYPRGHMMAQIPVQPVPLGVSWNCVKGSVQADSLALQLNVEFPVLRSMKYVWRRLRPRSLRPAWLEGSSWEPSSLRRPLEDPNV
jgi:hypothetical protein